MSLQEKIKERMALLNITPKKSLGQNFLVNEHVVNKIVDTVRSLGAENIIEVGPGLGSLTDELLKLNIPLQLIELDSVFADFWQKQAVKVVEQDALLYDWENLKNPQQTLLVSNLPYQISSSIVIDRSMDQKPLLAMVLMFQKEVAQRIMASQGKDYGLLSVIAQSFWKVSRLLEAGPRDFFPPPQIASRVLVFTSTGRNVGHGIENPKDFLKFVKLCFSQRRKLIISALKQSYSEEKITVVFTNLKIKPTARAEEISIENFQKMYKMLKA